MQQIRDNITGYITENPKAEFDQIKAQFGAPEAIAAAYVESTGTADILKSLQIRRKIITIVIAVATAVLIAWTGVVAWAAIEAKNSMCGTIEVITGVVEDGNEISAVEETDSISFAP